MSKKMNPEIKAKWLEALRSGKYKQAFGKLRIEDANRESSFCCLGILCHIIDPARWAPARPLAVECTSYAYAQDSENYPPDYILTLAGLEFDASREFARMNDNEFGFQAIANAIEENV